MNTTATTSVSTTEAAQPWQLQMFSYSLKKKQKLALILDQIEDTTGKQCMLITGGDNNGALNYHFRANGGSWTWVENEEEHIPEMSELLGEPVLLGSASRIPVEDGNFDVVVVIDVHEHLSDPMTFNRELRRVVKPGGMVVVSTPNGDLRKPLVLLKNAVGMTKEKYGHVVVGYTIEQHDRMLSEVGLVPQSAGTYAKFFSEFIELLINFAYVQVLSKKSRAKVKQGTIAPSSSEQLKSVQKQFRLYSLVYPLIWMVSKLDVLLFFVTGYAVSVVSRRPA